MHLQDFRFNMVNNQPSNIKTVLSVPIKNHRREVIFPLSRPFFLLLFSFLLFIDRYCKYYTAQYRSARCFSSMYTPSFRVLQNFKDPNLIKKWFCLPSTYVAQHFVKDMFMLKNENCKCVFVFPNRWLVWWLWQIKEASVMGRFLPSPAWTKR